MEKNEQRRKKYLWLFIPSSSFSTRLRFTPGFTDVGRGILLFLSSLASVFPFPFFGINIHIPVLFDVTATCCSHFLCSLVFLKNVIINKYTMLGVKCVYLFLYLMKALQGKCFCRSFNEEKANISNMKYFCDVNRMVCLLPLFTESTMVEHNYILYDDVEQQRTENLLLHVLCVNNISQ